MAIDTIKATAILDGAVDTADLADGAVSGVKIANGAVDTTQLANSSVTTDKITDGNITVGKLASTLDLSSNTITLPNGSVLDAMIDGMSSSKLSGALPAVDGSALTGIETKIKQIQYATQSTPEVSVNVGSAYTWNTVTITPQSNSSVIFLCINPTLYTRAADGGAGGDNWIQLEDITNTTFTKVQGWVNYADDTTVPHGFRQKHMYSIIVNNTVTTQRQFRFRYYANGGGGGIGRIGDSDWVVTLAVEFET